MNRREMIKAAAGAVGCAALPAVAKAAIPVYSFSQVVGSARRFGGTGCFLIVETPDGAVDVEVSRETWWGHFWWTVDCNFCKTPPPDLYFTQLNT